MQRIGPASCPVLVELLRKDIDSRLLDMAGQVLIDFEQESCPTLLEIWKGGSQAAQVKMAGLMAVLEMEFPEDLLDKFRDFLENPRSEFRLEAVKFLGWYAPQSEEAKALLIGAQNDKSAKVRSKIKAALKGAKAHNISDQFGIRSRKSRPI